MKCSAFIATSLDGFVARQDGSIDWLMQANEYVPNGEDGGYRAFISNVDVIVMGRYSYEKVLSFESWPYTLPVIVISSQKQVIPEHLTNTVSFYTGTPKQLVTDLSEKGFNHLYIDGGLTIQSFLNEGLIDELIITVIPTLIGQGKRLFGELQHDIQLELIGCREIASSFVQMHYKVKKHGGRK